MSDQTKLYVITLWEHKDLDDLYKEMKERGIVRYMKRATSRNTYYWMTESQAEDLKSDSRVRDVSLHYSEFNVEIKSSYVSYTIQDGSFYKGGETGVTTTSKDWGKLYSAGTLQQRRRGSWGFGGYSVPTSVTDTVNIFSDGRDVDVVIVDEFVSVDCDEWKSPSTGETRLYRYNNYGFGYTPDTKKFYWYNLNQYVPEWNIIYIAEYENVNNPAFHGNHVTSTCAGKFYGWAREANIYSLPLVNIFNSVDYGVVYDLLRAFHKYKPINPNTGKRNPTITNHSYGMFLRYFGMPNTIASIYSNNVTYNSNNPGLNGWNVYGLETDWGISAHLFNNYTQIPYFDTSLTSDVEDMIADGVVVIGAAGNSSRYVTKETDPNYNDSYTTKYVSYRDIMKTGISTGITINLKKGNSPAANGMISVGALNNQYNVDKAYYSNYGSGIDIWAPGSGIVGAVNFVSGGIPDAKYGGTNMYFVLDGTSMASPQVAGVAACLASGKERFTQYDMLNYISQHSNDNELVFNQNRGDGRNWSHTIQVYPDLVGNQKCVSHIDTRAAVLDQNGTTTYFFASASDRWVGNETEEDFIPQVNRDVVIYLGDKISARFPIKNCYLDVGNSNSIDGWTFGQSSQFVGLSPGTNYRYKATSNADPYWLPCWPACQGDRNYTRNYAVGIKTNPTLTFVVGDQINITGIGTTHPFWIKTSLGVGTAGALTTSHLYNNGGQGRYRPPSVSTFSGDTDPVAFSGSAGIATGELVWLTSTSPPGTYYYQSSNDPNMYGEINLLSRESAYGNRRMFFKTSPSLGTMTDLIQSDSFYVINNGGIGYDFTISRYDSSYDLSYFDTSKPGISTGTYYFQCESYNYNIKIIVLPRPGAGSYHDGTASKDSPTKFLNCKNPRPSSGNIDTVPVGRRDSIVRYPRRSTIVRAK